MPDPRWSADEITAKFGRIESRLIAQDHDVVDFFKRLEKLEERNSVLEARVAELEEALDEL